MGSLGIYMRGIDIKFREAHQNGKEDVVFSNSEKLGTCRKRVTQTMYIVNKVISQLTVEYNEVISSAAHQRIFRL